MLFTLHFFAYALHQRAFFRFRLCGHPYTYLYMRATAISEYSKPTPANSHKKTSVFNYGKSCYTFGNVGASYLL